jgi:tetratricopeptide (TPR) repeat protein
MVECFLKLLLLKTFHSEKEQKYVQGFIYLSIAHRLIDQYKPFLKTTNSLSECVKVYLNISKYLIKNYNFTEAQKYIEKCIFFLKKELLFRNNFSNDIKSRSKKTNKTFIHYSIVYLYYGLVQEFLGNINVAIYAYSLSKFISNKFIIEKYIIIPKFISMIYNRSVQYKEAINYFNEQQEWYEKEKLRIRLLEIEKKKAYEQSKKQLFDLMKDKETEAKLENIKIPQIDGIEKNIIGETREQQLKKYNYGTIMTSSLKLIQTYMDDE